MSKSLESQIMEMSSGAMFLFRARDFSELYESIQNVFPDSSIKLSTNTVHRECWERPVKLIRRTQLLEPEQFFGYRTDKVIVDREFWHSEPSNEEVAGLGLIFAHCYRKFYND